MKLAAEQRAVVEHDGGDVLVVGDHATGKTTTLVARYLRLLDRHPASRLLVICADRAAAGRFVDAALPRLGGGFDWLPVTTVYGLAHDLVSRSQDRPVQLISSTERRALVRRLLDAEDPGDWPELGRYLGRPAFADEVARALPATTGPEELARFARRYATALDERGQVDAGGLLQRAAGVAGGAERPLRSGHAGQPLRSGHAGRPLRSGHAGRRFDHVIVDAADALGDLGAAVVDALIGTGAAATIAAEPGDLPVLGFMPTLTVALGRRWRAAPPGKLLCCVHPSIEPEAVAGQLLAASRQGVPWSAMAVLVRDLGHRARGVARALARHGIPVVANPALAGGEPVVQSVVDMLAWAKGDDAALDRLLVSPLSSLDAAAVRSLRREVAAGQVASIEESPAVSRLVDLRDHLRRREAQGDTPADLAYEVWSRGLAHLADDRALDALVAFIDGLAQDGAEPDQWRVSSSAGSDGVTITSISGSRGREWHTVIVAGCVEGELPRTRRRGRLFDGLRGPNAVAAAERHDRAEEVLAEERRLFALATSRATTTLIATAAPEPGVLLSRLVEGWPTIALDLPLAPGQAPPQRQVTAGAAPAYPDRQLNLSASQLDTYDDCPLRYAYQYLLRARQEAGVHAGLGTLVHDVLEEFLDPAGDRPRTYDALLEVAEAHWRDDIAPYRPQVEEVRRDFVAMLNGWWEAEGSRGDLGPEVLAVERRFDIEVGDHRVAGAIDRVDRADDGEGIRVLDYKTGKREPTAADVEQNLQLAVYHLAATRDPNLADLGVPTQLRLLYLRSMRALDQPVTPDHAARTEARVLATAERILAEEFEPAIDANCRTCAFHRLCPLQPEGRRVGEA